MNRRHLKQFKSFCLDDAIQYHLDNSIPIVENVFRFHSNAFYETIERARNLFDQGLFEGWSEKDIEIFSETDFGRFEFVEGGLVPLDCPFQEEVELDSPKRGGNKKFYVYVKDGDKIKKVEFGDTSGLQVKINDPEARKSFVARHQCDKKTDKTKPGYWSCNLPKYAKSLGLSGGGNFYW